VNVGYLYVCRFRMMLMMKISKRIREGG
jgi:hypothetical protein